VFTRPAQLRDIPLRKLRKAQHNVCTRPPTAMGMLLAAGVHGSAAFGVDEKRME
jgi:hypothetical protein